MACPIFPFCKLTNIGSLDAPPKQVNWDGCAHTSCPAHSAPIGSNSSDPRLNWVNSFPVTAIKNGKNSVMGIYDSV